MRTTAVAAMLVASTSPLPACSEDPSPARACVPSSPDAGCAPLYEPSFDQIFARTLQPSCAAKGVSCHASTGRQGGLAFEDADEAYRLLVTERRAAVAGDPACSAIVARVMATDGNFRMPPGRSLDPGEQCSIIQWIANGAKR